MPEGFGARVVMDSQKLSELVRGPSGPVIRDLIEAGEAVKREAQRRVGVYQPPDAYSAANRQRRPGTLRDRIVKRVVQGPTGAIVQVGAEDEVALLHHEGTNPHVIAARRRPLLVFFWPKVGHVVAMKSVRHPGTEPNRYLLDSFVVLQGRY